MAWVLAHNGVPTPGVHGLFVGVASHVLHDDAGTPDKDVRAWLCSLICRDLLAFPLFSNLPVRDLRPNFAATHLVDQNFEC